MSPEMMRLHAYCAALGDHRNGTFDAFIKAYGPGGRTLLAADLAALTAPARGDGAEWVTVPREPTEAMLAASGSAWSPNMQAMWPKIVTDIYRAMIAAAPAECWRDQTQYGACSCAAAPAAPAGDGASDIDYYPSHEALCDLISLQSEHWALNGGGPRWKERWQAALRCAEELVRVEP